MARFCDSDALALFIEDLSSVAYSTDNRVEWELTEETARTATSEARGLAVTDALTKAQEYAASIGLTTVTATAIAEPGMLDSVGTGEGDYSVGGANMRMMSSDSGGGPQLALKLEQISISTSVEARFSAS